MKVVVYCVGIFLYSLTTNIAEASHVKVDPIFKTRTETAVNDDPKIETRVAFVWDRCPPCAI